jgi:NAD(P)-dependent dehydrogenase (short-subunit alcohol dehydrogenase family)
MPSDREGARVTGGRLLDRTSLITGAGSGIGRATALLFAAEGAAVIVVDIDGAAAEATAAAVIDAGGSAVAVQADVTSSTDAERACAAAVDTFGGLDVVYNNAGVGSTGSVADATEDDWDHCFAVNVKGTFLMSRAALPHLADGRGAIVNQGSVAALVGVRNFAAYCAAKGAVVALTRSMAVDLADRRIRVNALCPGTVYTPLMEPLMRARGGGDLEAGIAATATKYPIGRLGTPEEIASAALFLASDSASFVTGSVFTVDGGMTAQ